MASPYNSTCTIGGNTFDALEILVTLETTPDRNGMPTMGSFTSIVRVVVDMSDTQNMPYSTLSSMFNQSNVATQQSIVPIKLEYWVDETKQNALCCFKFNGWISAFQTVNPTGNLADVTSQGQVINNMLIIDLQPTLNQANQPNFTFSN